MRYFYLGFLLVCIAVVSIAGLRGSFSRRPPMELFPDMVRQAKIRPQTPSDFFPDQISSRPHVDGTIAKTAAYEFEGQPVLIDGKRVFPYEDAPINTGRIA